MPNNESYTLGYGESSMEWMAARTADRHGAFLLDHLKPGQRVLDCGCGPGTLTFGFAQAVAPGETIGIDLDTGQTAQVHDKAHSIGLANLHFHSGNIYDLPYPDASFDVVFGSAVLGSLGEPDPVVKEMARVLRPGGVLALKEFDHAADVIYPQSDALVESIALYHRLREHNGHVQNAGRRLREFVALAGCECIEYRIFFDQQVTQSTLVDYIERNNRLFYEVLGPQYEQHGWCTAADIDRHVAAWREFALDPAAIYAAAWAECIGRKPA